MDYKIPQIVPDVAYSPAEFKGISIKLDKPIKYEISEEIQKRAINCTNGLNCLADDKHRLCNVVKCIEGRTHYIKCIGLNGCHYRESIDGLYYKCSCPVRMEIYNQFQV